MQRTLRSAGLSFGAVMLAALASAAQADSLKPDEWQTEPFDRGDGCYTAQILPDGVMLGFHYMLEKDEFRLTLASENWEEQVPEEGIGAVTVTIQTRSGKRQLASKEAYAIKAGSLEAVAGIWFGSDGKAARKAFAAGSEIEVSYEGRSLGTFPLTGADKALGALEDCFADLDKG